MRSGGSTPKLDFKLGVTGLGWPERPDVSSEVGVLMAVGKKELASSAGFGVGDG